MEMTGAQILMETLLEQGTDVIFGYPGGTVLDLYEQIYRNEGRIRHVLPSHEQGGIHAADGYARATGKTGVVLATSGPGATNLVTGIATAYLDSIPLVIITGNVPTTLIWDCQAQLPCSARGGAGGGYPRGVCHCGIGQTGACSD